MKQNLNLDLQRCTALMKRRCPTLKQRLINVEQRRYNHFSTLCNVVTTFFNVNMPLFQCCFNVAATLVKAISKPIWSVKSMDLQTD